MADNAIIGEATCSGHKPIPTLKCKAVEVLKSIKTAITCKKKAPNATQKSSKSSTSKKGKNKAPPPPEDSDIELISMNGDANKESTGVEGTPTPQVNSSGPSQWATVEDEPEESEVTDDDKEESSEVEMERLKDDWNVPIYAFFHPVPTIGYEKGQHYHKFKCFASGCTKSVRCYLDKQDAKSTSNLHKHAKLCWGVDTVRLVMETGDIGSAHCYDI